LQKKDNKRRGDDLLNTYINQIRDYPLLSFDDELELSKQIQKGNSRALHRLINSNLRLVIKIAGSYNVPDVPILDIIQEGNIGLIHAAEKFDYNKNVRFSTYAGFWIRQFMSRFLSNKRRIIRLPLRKEESIKKIQRAYNVLCQRLTHLPASTDIAKELGMSVQEVDSIVSLTSDSLSFEHGNKDDKKASVIDVHEDYTYNPEQTLLRQCSQDGALRILDKLKVKEKYILSYRFQLNGCELQTLRQLGVMFNISPETVRQIEKRALAKMRNHAGMLKDYLCVG
jgi:RNA polymerase primary sigma factor